MELTIDQKTLARVLARAASVSSPKSPLQMLQNALIEADGDTVRVRATDLHVGVDLTATAKVKSPGAVCVEARHIADVARNLPAGDITLKAAGTCLDVRVGGRKTHFKIPCLLGDDFPNTPRPSSKAAFTVSARELVRMLSQGAYAAREDMTRPFVASALFDPTEAGFRIVCTDGYRMAYAVGECTGTAIKMLVPLGAHGEIKRMCDGVDGDVTIECSGGYAFFTVGTETLSAKLLEEQFPPYERIIPKSSPNTLTVLRDPLLDMLKRVRIEAKNAISKRSKVKDAKDKKGATPILQGIRLIVARDSIAATTEHADGEAYDSIDCDAGFELRIGTNADYLIEAISAVRDDEVTLAFDGDLDPIVVKAPSGECLSVTMPMRL